MLLPIATLPSVVPDAAAAQLLFAPLVDSPVERAVVAYLGQGAKLLGVRLLPPGTHDAVAVPIRQVVADALALDATALVLAHSHPGGNPQPSPADLTLTRRLAQTLAAVEVRLTDHLVIAGEAVTSFRERGLL